MELKYASQFQVYEIPLTATDLDDLRKNGLGLRLRRGSELEIITGGTDVPPALLPHLMVPGGTSETAEFFQRMKTLACVQPFGWMESCVLDGLLDLSASAEHREMRDSAARHLSLFIHQGKLVYEDPVSVPSGGKLHDMESCLPFAAMARMDPNSPLLNMAVDFWQSHLNAKGLIQDGGHLSSEGAYTVGYALAEIAKARRSEKLMRQALDQVRLRQSALFNGVEFWRTRHEGGSPEDRNWARGIAWQLLGLTRTLTVDKELIDISDLLPPLRELASWTLEHQREDGLLAVFVDEESLLEDTAGSAGIAAALAIGANQGWLAADARVAAQKTLKRLETHLTADGFLGGVSQSNKGGEALQRGGYRCIYQMGMGLMAQLIAALRG